MALKSVNSQVFPLKNILGSKYFVDYYQREYVWSDKQISDLMIDLSSEFLKQWKPDHKLSDTRSYDPYYMGEIVLSEKEDGMYAIIDGQQRITSLTLLLIYIKRTFGHIPKFPSDVEKLIYSEDYGDYKFNLDIPDRNECMLDLNNNGVYQIKGSDSNSVKNLVERYNDIAEFWNQKIDDTNIVAFAYWLIEKVCFSKVWTNNDEFAYVIFETMNDRGLSLTQVEMLRSYLLANISESNNARDKAMTKFDNAIKKLVNIKLNSKSKAEFEFFKVFLRTHYANDLTQSNSNSDFVRIGKEFHRWVKDNDNILKLNDSDDFVRFMDKIEYYVNIYEKIYSLIEKRNTLDYLYLIVNNDYGFTLQPALIMASIKYMDSDDTVEEKIKIISKYITKVLTWKVWNHNVISQSALEADIYNLAKAIREMNITDLKQHLNTEPISLPDLSNAPILNQQNQKKIKVLLALITEIVAANSGEPGYVLNNKDIEIEHIWANIFSDHTDEFKEEAEFNTRRNTIGDLILLPGSFNSSYGKDKYEVKVVHYIQHNILAQSLNELKYSNNPGFINFKNNNNLDFKWYDKFTNESITERTNLYRNILEWNWISVNH